MTKHYEIRVFGRVQGVGFRYAVRNQARSLNLKGWVENQPDGSVLTSIQGMEKACLEFMHWCRSGTGFSWVERVEYSEKEPVVYKGFEIKY